MRTALVSAGWHPGRRVDVASYLEALQSESIALHEPARLFLESYGGLQFSWPRRDFVFDPGEAIEHMPRDVRTYLDSISADHLVPIGYGSNSYVLMGASSSAFLLNQDWLFYREYQTIGDCLEALILNRCGYPDDPVWLSRTQQPPGYQDSQPVS
jgi:hypothetical protein